LKGGIWGISSQRRFQEKRILILLLSLERGGLGDLSPEKISIEENI
jgi:hypothetical protein